MKDRYTYVMRIVQVLLQQNSPMASMCVYYIFETNEFLEEMYDEEAVVMEC